MAHPDLSPEQRAWFESAAALIDIDRLYRLNREITAIHSPTGRERAASEYMMRYLADIGVEARYQPMGETSGNAIGRIRGSGGGPSLLLYAPIDTHLDATEDDVPWVGPRLRPDMIPQVREQDGLLIGLGASNPKAMVTTLAEAARVVRAAKVPLKGDLFIAYAGGGMPVDLAAPGNRGLSDGVSHLLTRGVHTDFALVMKPGNAVYHEEPGLCWFKVSVKGTMGYAGMPHGLPTLPQFDRAGRDRSFWSWQDWLPRYTERNSSGQVAPRGWIAALRSGWPDRVSFPSATTEIYLDIRCNPRTPPAEVKAQFEEAIAAILARHPEVELEWEMTASLPGASTDPGELDHPVGHPRLGGRRGQEASGAAAHQRADRYFHDPQSRHPDRAHRLGEPAGKDPRRIPCGPRRHGRVVSAGFRRHLPQARLFDHRYLHAHTRRGRMLAQGLTTANNEERRRRHGTKRPRSRANSSRLKGCAFTIRNWAAAIRSSASTAPARARARKAISGATPRHLPRSSASSFTTCRNTARAARWC